MRKNKQSEGKLPLWLISPIAGILAFLLLSLVGPASLMQIQEVYAMDACGVLFLCPTPTPTPVLTPTATPTPRPAPTPIPTLPPTRSTPPTPLPTLKPVPTAMATTGIRPTTTSTPTSIHNVSKLYKNNVPTPIPSPTNIAVPKGGNALRQAPRPLPESNFSSMMVVALVIFLLLLFSLGAGLLILRRVLLPEIAIKVPAGGTTSWTRNGVPDVDNLEDQRAK